MATQAFVGKITIKVGSEGKVDFPYYAQESLLAGLKRCAELRKKILAAFGQDAVDRPAEVLKVHREDEDGTQVEILMGGTNLSWYGSETSFFLTLRDPPESTDSETTNSAGESESIASCASSPPPGSPVIVMPPFGEECDTGCSAVEGE
jgi:hypothetical protein